ncbi:MotA/TolQ/ExbB proton channel family protein [Betaproteobacteria bacterium]|nr:MotA/TolQ/ExbB proton channel family protein [Betaproteobacteria bacterium]
MLEVVRSVDRSKSLFMFCMASTLFFIFFHCSTVRAQETETSEKAVDVGSSILSEEKNNENNNNAYGFSELWSQGDIVARLTLIVLILMSIGTWTIFFTKFLDQRRIYTHANELKSVVTLSKNSSEIFHSIGSDRFESLRVFTLPIRDSFSIAERLNGKDVETVHEVIHNGVQEGISEMDMEIQKGLTFLATVGSTAPFVGLFGTVWAIYHALIGIGIAGEATLDKVAGPVGEALIMTAIGLAVAVPAVLAYNWLLRRNKSIVRIITNVSNKIVYSVSSS